MIAAINHALELTSDHKLLYWKSPFNFYWIVDLFSARCEPALNSGDSELALLTFRA